MRAKGSCRQTVSMGMSVAALALMAAQVGCSHKLGGEMPPPEGCRASAWTPEEHTFWGSAQNLKDRLKALDAKLSERRVCMYIVENGQTAELALFERPKIESDPWVVWRWQGASSEANRIREAENKRITELQGSSCVGDATKEILKSLPLQEDKTSASPPTSAEAFEEAINRSARDAKRPDYMRATFYVLC